MRESVLARIVLLAFVLLASFPHTFEREFSFNELLSLIGFLWFLHLARIGNLKAYDSLFFSALIILFFFRWVMSAFEQDYLVAYARHSSLVYSMFAFYLGGLVVKHRSRLFDGQWLGRMLGIVLLILPVQRIFVIGALPLMLGGREDGVMRWVVVLLFSLLVIHGGGSPVFGALFIVFMVYQGRNLYLFFLGFSLAFFLLLFWVGGDIKEAMTYRFALESYGGAVSILYNLDPNLLTRIALWYQAVEAWLSSPFIGVGFGVEMFDTSGLLIAFEDFEKNRYLGYFLGAHNSLLTVLARGGLLLSIPLVAYLLVLLKKSYWIYKDWPSDRAYVLSFWLTSSVMLLNVVLESPIYSGFFWFSVGMVAHLAREFDDRARCVSYRVGRV